MWRHDTSILSRPRDWARAPEEHMRPQVAISDPTAVDSIPSGRVHARATFPNI